MIVLNLIRSGVMGKLLLAWCVWHIIQKMSARLSHEQRQFTKSRCEYSPSIFGVHNIHMARHGANAAATRREKNTTSGSNKKPTSAARCGAARKPPRPNPAAKLIRLD